MSSNSEEIEKLKSLVAKYKKKSTQAIHALYENEHQKNRQESVLAHQIKELQAQIQELSEVKESSLHTLPNDEQKEIEIQAQDLISQLKEQLKLTKSNLEKCTQELQQVRNEKQEIANEMHALVGQLTTLKTKVTESQETSKTISKEKKQLENYLADKLRLYGQLENEIISLKQAVTNADDEAKNNEESKIRLTQEKIVLEQKIHNLEQFIERQKEEIQLVHQQLSETIKNEVSAKLQMERQATELQEKHRIEIHDMQKSYKELEQSLQKHHTVLHEKEQEIQNCVQQIELLKQEKFKWEDTFASMTRNQSEQEACIRVAQQHLGKKVKEVTLLNEKLEEQKVQISDLQTMLSHYQAKMAETEASFQQQLHQEKKYQDQIQEMVKIAEEKTTKWEEKYLAVFEKLKVLEEKQYQIQTLFASWGHIMGTHHHIQSSVSTPSFSSPSSSLSSPRKSFHLVDTQNLQVQNVDEIPKEEQQTLSQPSLFDLDTQRASVRQTLFD